MPSAVLQVRQPSSRNLFSQFLLLRSRVWDTHMPWAAGNVVGFDPHGTWKHALRIFGLGGCCSICRAHLGLRKQFCAKKSVYYPSLYRYKP